MLRKTLLKSIAIAGVLAAGLASAASAATYSYDLTTLSAGTTSLTVNGLTVTLGAGTFTGGLNKVVSSAPASAITYSSAGLGSTAATSYTSGRQPTTAIDAPASGLTNLREFISFSFKQSVRLVSVTLTNILSGSNLIVLENNAVQDESIFTAASATTYFPTATYDYYASVFGIGARSTQSLAASSFTISGITVEYVAPVPLPAGGLLLGSLVLVPFLRRKRAA